MKTIAITLILPLILWTISWQLLKFPPPLPDFSQHEEPAELKKAFFEYLQPLIEEQNSQLAQQRETVKALEDAFARNGDLNFLESWQLSQLVAEYMVAPDLTTAEELQILKRRVDIIPEELVAVQAAKESSWGRSRFAIEANNLFGQWCFTPGCGLVPKRRMKGKTHELAAFESVEASIASYMGNLNTNPSYLDFRMRRLNLRAAAKPLSGLELANGLLFYSERREAYVQEVQAMIRNYRSLISP